MSEQKVWTFFYGLYINFSALREVDLVLGEWETARLMGYELRIAPRANLVPADGKCVFGIVGTAAHEELDRLYRHAKEILGETYLPMPVLVETLAGGWRPALCYVAPAMKGGPADPYYVGLIAKPARAYGFPEWYVAHIESFRV